jgi:hypothetical protein
VALVLGDEGGLEFAVAVARDADGQFALVAAQGFGAVAVAGVGLAGGRALVLVVAEVGGQLAFQHPVDQALFELGEQPVGTSQVAGLAVVLEQLVEQLVVEFRGHGRWFVVGVGGGWGPAAETHLHKIYYTPLRESTGSVGTLGGSVAMAGIRRMSAIRETGEGAAIFAGRASQFVRFWGNILRLPWTAAACCRFQPASLLARGIALHSR